jgi:hypothetical protein
MIRAARELHKERKTALRPWMDRRRGEVLLLQCSKLRDIIKVMLLPPYRSGIFISCILAMLFLGISLWGERKPIASDLDAWQLAVQVLERHSFLTRDVLEGKQSISREMCKNLSDDDLAEINDLLEWIRSHCSGSVDGLFQAHGWQLPVPTRLNQRKMP